jgi:hypothetical protein
VTAIAFADDDFQHGLDLVLGGAHRGAAEIGDVLATAARIPDGDADAWVREWTATAGAAWAAGGEAVDAGRRVSARGHYLRAAAYYATALHVVARSAEPERHLDLWRRQRACWDRAVDLFDVPPERLAIAYEDTTLPGYFFGAPGAADGAPRPTIIINNSSDGATSQTWTLGGAAAAERGYHWMTFDGPGQQAALFEQGLTFRPDWEAVLTPVLDALLARPDVDPDRVAVLGIGQAGFWVPRALAFEHRFAAAVVDPGVVDVAAGWTAALPDAMLAQLRHGDHTGFDRDMHLAELFSPTTAALLRFRGAPYRPTNGASRAELFTTVARYRLGDEVAQITTPLLITDPDGEQFWPGQSRQLFDRLPGPKHLVRFRADEGAAGHYEPLAPALRDARIFDWLDGHLA